MQFIRDRGDDSVNYIQEMFFLCLKDFT